MRHSKNRLLSSNLLALLLDVLVAAISLPLAFYVRLGDDLVHESVHLIPASASFTLITLGLLLLNRTYRRVWRYSSLNDVLHITRLAGIALLVFYVGLFLITRLENMPRSVVFIHSLSFVAFLLAGRVLARLYHDRQHGLLGNKEPVKRIPVLLVGATPDAEMFIRESQRNAAFPYEVVAIIDDVLAARGREIHHVRIYGPLASIEDVLHKLHRRDIRPQRVIVADHQIAGEDLSALVEAVAAMGLSLARLPRLSELRDGEARLTIRPIAVEDILGRPQTVLDFDAMRALVAGKNVLITGAGGSIGSELTRQVAGFAPSQLVLYEMSEFLLYEIGRELAEDFPDLSVAQIMGDVRNAEQLTRVFGRYKPDIVFHAAAIKHVPLAEENVDQAVLTNVLGSKNVADCCIAYQVSALVQISTDKAVNPSSLMGATKRIAEIYAQTAAQAMDEGAPTRIITVRFGNVLGSNGSVVPLFQRQIEKGGPVTVTHPEMTRYLMTIKEAVQLVLQAAALGRQEQERAPIFVLEMGQPVKIISLAEQMIRLAGLIPNEDIAITFTGMRPGEKLYEELFHQQENLMETVHPSICKARARRFDVPETTAQIKALIALAERAGDTRFMRDQVQAIVPEYSPFQEVA